MTKRFTKRQLAIMFEALELCKCDGRKENMVEEIEKIQWLLHNRMGGYSHPAYQKARVDFNLFEIMSHE